MEEKEKFNCFLEYKRILIGGRYKIIHLLNE